MALSRRSVMRGAALTPLAPLAAPLAATSSQVTADPGVEMIRPRRLRKGSAVRIVAPASVTYDANDLAIAVEALSALGLTVSVGRHVMDRHGYLAGEDAARADDINRAFADPAVDGVIALRGGWGAARTLPHVDFEVIAQNPKVFMGYSDITTLLNAITAKTGLVTFHGPNANTVWDPFTTSAMRAVLFDGKALTMRNPAQADGTLAVRNNRIQTITKGQAAGPVFGGNLTLFAGLLGTSWFPDTAGALIFLEEVGEYIYRCDRLINQLALAGAFDGVAGIVLGGFTDCGVDPSGGYGTFSLNDVFKHHFEGLGIPVFAGAMVGHVREKRTMPVGLPALMNADEGTLTLSRPAVV
ncbi:MAG: LD-carboxypeptidase [Pseudomonadota bacterium]